MLTCEEPESEKSLNRSGRQRCQCIEATLHERMILHVTRSKKYIGALWLRIGSNQHSACLAASNSSIICYKVNRKSCNRHSGTTLSCCDPRHMRRNSYSTVCKSNKLSRNISIPVKENSTTVIIHNDFLKHRFDLLEHCFGVNSIKSDSKQQAIRLY